MSPPTPTSHWQPSARLLKSCFPFSEKQNKWSAVFFQVIISNLSITVTVFPSVLSPDLIFIKWYELSEFHALSTMTTSTPLPQPLYHQLFPPILFTYHFPLLCTWATDFYSSHWGINLHLYESIFDHFSNLSRSLQSSISSKLLTTNLS